MTSLNNPVNLPLDTNGYVKSNIYAQNINPNVNTVASVTGAVGSVTGAVGSVTGAVGSVTGAVGSVTNPVTSWITISHQTGLSGSNSTANAPTNVGTAISITKDGIISVEASGHVSANVGGIRIVRTRASVIDYINQYPNAETSSSMKSSLFTDTSASLGYSTGINSTTRCRLVQTGSVIGTPYPSIPGAFSANHAFSLC